MKSRELLIAGVLCTIVLGSYVYTYHVKNNQSCCKDDNDCGKDDEKKED